MSESPTNVLTPLSSPRPLPPRRGRDLLVGIGLPPEKRLQAFSPDDLEVVLEHWLHHKLGPCYAVIAEYAGAGDGGRDRAAFEGPLGSDPWDNYQCKQYGRKLSPSDIYSEVGKLIYHVAQGSYSRPRRYAFVAAKGLGPSALDLLGDPEKLRAGLKRVWNKRCSDLCALEEIEDALNTFVFPEFQAITAGQIIDDLQDASVYPYFFGGGLTKPRPPDQVAPEHISEHELPYVGELVRAYDDHCQAPVSSVEEALGLEPYGPHLRASRQDFYCAESLREFSRDAFPDPQTFQELQKLVEDGIRHTILRSHPSGFDRVLATCEHATAVQLGDHPLAGEVNPADRSGICHQLVNEGRVRWMP